MAGRRRGGPSHLRIGWRLPAVLLLVLGSLAAQDLDPRAAMAEFRTAAREGATEVRLVELAMARREAMRALVRKDPEAALREAIPATERGHLPAKVLDLLEKPISGIGSFQVIADTPELPDQKVTIRRRAIIDGVTYDVSAYGAALRWPSGGSISLHGVAIDGTLALRPSRLRVLEPGELPTKGKAKKDLRCPVSGKAAGFDQEPDDEDPDVIAESGDTVYYLCSGGHLLTVEGQVVVAEGQITTAQGEVILPSAWTEGPKTLLYSIVRCSDEASFPQTVANAETMLQAVNTFYIGNSFGITEFSSWDIVEVVLPKTKAEYQALGDTAFLSEARSVTKTQTGKDYLTYNLDAIRHSSIFSGWAGQAYVGGRGCWLQSSSAGVARHEFGHNYGLWHANYWNAGGDTVIGSGSNSEYGDSFDTMGSSGSNGYFNAYEQYRLNWLVPGEVWQVTSSGTYRVHGFDSGSKPVGNKYGLYVPQPSTGHDYWVMSRSSQFTTNIWMQKGVQLLWDPWTSSNGGSQLLDTTPGTPDGKNDSPIVLGRTFTDATSGVHITPVAKFATAPSSYDVVVNLGAFPGNRDPVASLTASATSVPTNTPVTFTVTATDADGDPLAYWWNFGWTAAGDKVVADNAASVSKGWASAGKYVVQVTVSDMKGGTRVLQVLVTVGSPTTFILAGTVRDLDGNPVAGARIHNGLTAGAYRGGYSASDGTYQITNLAAGSYTLGAVLAGTVMTVDGWSNPVTVGPDASGIDWRAEIQTYSISGTVKDGAANVGGVTVSAGTRSAISASNGTYTITGVPDGSYTLSATKVGYTFAPVGWSNPVTVASGNVTGRNFDTPTYTVSGEILGNIVDLFTVGNGVVSVQSTIQSTGSGKNRVTRNLYTLTGVKAGTWNLTAKRTASPTDAAPFGWTNPLTVAGNQTGRNFDGSNLTNPGSLSISGTIRNPVGDPVAGITVSTSGGSAVSAANGTYTIPGLLTGSHVVTPTTTGWTYAPSSRVVSLGGSNVVGQDFTATSTSPVPTKLVFTVQPPSGTVGVALSPAVKVSILDTNGNVATGSTLAVSLALGANPSGAALGGTTTVNAVAGVATFPTLTVSKTGTGYTLVASAAGVNGATSATFTITGGVATKLAFVQQPTGANPGSPIVPAITVAIQDAVGNQTTSTATVTLAIGTNPGSGTLSGTVSKAAVNGLATFSGLSINQPGVGYTLSAASTGLSGATSSTFTIALADGTGTGITREVWTGIAGTTVSALTAAAAYPDSPTTSETLASLFEAPTNAGDTYGQRVHGYFLAPVTGNYVFVIASDDSSELWLGTGSDPATAVKIAEVVGATGSRQWTTFASQTSAAIPLVAGQQYYIRALHKDGTGSDNLAVGVTIAGGFIEQPIPYHRLKPWDGGPANPGVLALTVATLSVGEGAGSASLSVARTGGSSGAVSVAFATGNPATATAGADYTASSGTLSWSAGDSTAKTITVPIIQDTLDENDEIFTVTISAPTGGATLGSTTATTVTITDDDPAPTVTLGLSGSPMVEAGGVGTVTATLSAASSRNVTIGLTFGGTASASDYNASGTSIVIPAGSTSRSMTLTAVQDLLDEPNETIAVDISTVTNGTESGTQQVTATITDDDAAPTATLSLTGSPMVEAGGAGSVTATLSAVSGQAVTVNLGFTGTATGSGTDYTASAASIVIPAGSTNGSMTLTAVQDVLDEPNETIVVDITTVTNGTESGTQKVTATITDDDAAPTITLSLTGSPMAEAGGVGTVTATLSAVSGQAATIALGFSGTATGSGTDYTSSATSIVIPAGSLTGSMTLTAAQDLLDESNETIVVDITTVTNGTESGTQQVTATITDDDSPPTLSISPTSGPEGDSGTSTLSFAVALSAPSGVAVTANWATANGTASAGSDYVAANGSVNIPAGSTVTAVLVTVNGDTTLEPDEAFTVTLTSPSGAVLGTAVATGTIVNDDGAVSPNVTLSLTGSPMVEAGGVGTVTATLSTVSSQTVTVGLGFTGTATGSGTDYTASASSIVIPAGSTSGSMTLTASQDTLDEANETVIVDITSVTNGTESGTQKVTATITDDDPLPTVTLSTGAPSITEASGSTTITATLSAISGRQVTVNISFSGSAGGTDYTMASSIVIPAGSASAGVTLTATQDALVEGDETVVIDVSTVTNGTESGAQQITVTIIDDEGLPLVSISRSPTSITENGGVSTLTLSLSAASTQAVTVTLIANGTASSSDYVLSTTSVVIPAGSTSATATVTAVQDTLDEDNETVGVEVGAVVNGAENGAQTATVTITDDDPLPGVGLSLTGSPIAEAGGVSTVTATLSAVSGRSVVVNLGFTGSASNGTDYTPSSGSVVIPAGSLSASVLITAIQDTLDEANETVLVDIVSVVNGTETGVQQVSTVITDDDNGPLVSLSAAPLSVSEAGETSTLTATLAAASGQQVTVNLGFSGSASGSDYTCPVSIDIPAGSLTGTVALTGIDDTLDESNETATVAILTVINGSENGVQTVNVVIVDNDPLPTVTLDPASVVEGNAGTTSLTFTIGLSAISGKTVSIPWAAMDDTATEPDDYLATSGVLVIPAGSASGTVQVTVNGDTDLEPDETVQISLSTPTNAILDATSSKGTIVNDDGTGGSALVTMIVSSAAIPESGGMCTVTVILNQIVTTEVTVTLSLSGTATLASDYTFGSTTLVIPAGSTSMSRTLSSVGDTMDESNETVTIAILSVAGAFEDGTQSETVTIVDDDPTPSLSVKSLKRNEGNAGITTATISVLSGSPSSSTVTVFWTATAGTATAGADFIAASGSLSFPPGSTSQTFSLSILGDTAEEAHETVVITLSAPVNAVIGSPIGILTIVNDDGFGAFTSSDGKKGKDGCGVGFALGMLVLGAAFLLSDRRRW